jgi:ankyrin repeat protein
MYIDQITLGLVLKGHVMMMKLLLARDDIDVNAKDDYGQTPLSNSR